MTQHEKITKLHNESEWVCGNAYREQFIFSSHKRRGEMSSSHKDFKLAYSKYGITRFEDRDCEHGSRGVRDYRVVKEPPKVETYQVIGNRTQQEIKV